MADNFLERRMEDYRLGKLSAPKRRITPNGSKAGYMMIEFKPRRILVVIPGKQRLLREIVKILANTGSKVAFIGKDENVSQKMAQELGAQYHPLADSIVGACERAQKRICEKWGGIDAVLIDGDEPLLIEWALTLGAEKIVTIVQRKMNALNPNVSVVSYHDETDEESIVKIVMAAMAVKSHFECIL